MVYNTRDGKTTLQEDVKDMPTYVYACDSCGAQFEQFQSFKDEPLRTCPQCAGAVRRVFQPVGIVFKGSGWYITDSRKSSSASVASDDAAKTEKPSGDNNSTATAATPKPEASSEAKTSDTKPAATA
jgi:putative FmdB family regulatory protein